MFAFRKNDHFYQLERIVSTRKRSKLRLRSGLRLIHLNQVANALRITLAVAMAGDGIRPAGRFNHNLRPEHAGGDMHRSDLRHRDALFIRAEQARFDPDHPLWADDQFGGKEKIALGPPARGKSLSGRGIWRVGSGSGQWYEPRYRTANSPNYKVTQNFYTHSSAPFFHTQTYPAIRITRKISISTRPNRPNALNFTAHGNRKIVSTSNTTNKIAMM